MNKYKGQTKKNYFNRLHSKRGQSLIELSIFSSIIIFSISTLVGYALSYNHNQNTAMKAFRRAMKLANEERSTSLSANINLIYDKAVADPSSIFGVPKRVPISFSTNAVHSNDLYSEMTGAREELPRTVYDINGKVYKLTTGAFIKTTLTAICTYTLHNGQFSGTYEFPGVRRKAFIDNWDGKGVAWHWEAPNTEDTSSNNDRKIDNNTQWDIDGDGEEESIIYIDLPAQGELSLAAGEMQDNARFYNGEYPAQSSGRPDDDTALTPEHETQTMEIDVNAVVLDSQEGELDMTEEEPGLTNGLIPESKSVEKENNQLINQNKSGLFQTKTRIKNEQVIERRIRLNPRLTDFSDIEAQIAQNNPGGGSSYCDSLDVEDSSDCILIEGNQKFLVIRSKFSTDKEAYNWERKAD